jgi:hypothetical protein
MKKMRKTTLLQGWEKVEMKYNGVMTKTIMMITLAPRSSHIHMENQIKLLLRQDIRKVEIR